MRLIQYNIIKNNIVRPHDIINTATLLFLIISYNNQTHTISYSYKLIHFVLIKAPIVEYLIHKPAGKPSTSFPAKKWNNFTRKTIQ